VAGARVGYVLFYNFFYYLHHLLEISATWHGGMSFHGGLLGLLLGGWLFCRRYGLSFWRTADTYAVALPISLGFGRIGNFINGELFGRVTDVPWAMIFPTGGPLPRHPSQIYQALLEGLLLFVILWRLKNRYWRSRWPAGVMTALFLVLYGVFRCLAELFREPDAQVGFLIGSLTRGQLLSCFMIIGGLLLLWAKGRHYQAFPKENK